MDDQDSGRPSRRRLFRELFRRREKRSAKGNQGSTSKSDEGIEGERTRTDLWGAAYEQFQKEDPKLLVAYKKYLLVPRTKRDQGTSSDNAFYPVDITIVASGCCKRSRRKITLYRK
jgi:hypothetical protein